MCVTVFASQPSVSIDTETTHRMCSPSFPGFADGVHDLAEEIFIVKVVTGAAREPGSIISFELLDFNRGQSLEFSGHPSPDSSCSESTRIVFGARRPTPCSSLLKSGNSPGTRFQSRSRAACSIRQRSRTPASRRSCYYRRPRKRAGSGREPVPERSVPIVGKRGGNCRRGCGALPASSAGSFGGPLMVSVLRPFFGKSSRIRSQRSR